MAQTHGLRYAGESSLSTMGASTIADATLTRLEEEGLAAIAFMPVLAWQNGSTR